MSALWTPVTSSHTEHRHQQEQTPQESPTSSSSKKYNEIYKTRKYSQILETWGPASIHLVRGYLSEHPNRRGHRPMDEINEESFPELLPYIWTYKLFRIANRVQNYEKALEYIRYQTFKRFGENSKCLTTAPEMNVLEAVNQMIDKKLKPKPLTETQLKRKGLRIASTGLLEIGTEVRHEEEDGDIRGFASVESLRSTSRVNGEDRPRRSKRLASRVATRLARPMSDHFFTLSDESGSNWGDYSGDDSGDAVSSTASDYAIEGASMTHNNFTDTEKTYTLVTKMGSGLLSLDSQHPEIIARIGKYLLTKDCMSLALTNQRCQRAVRHILLKGLLNLAVDNGDFSKVKGLLESGAIVHWDISEEDDPLDHPIVRAAARGQLRISQAFIHELQKDEHEVSPQQRQRLETAAFLMACAEGAQELVDYYLLMRGALNCSFNERAALETAIRHSQADVVELLIEAGARPTIEDLELAYATGSVGVVSCLVCKCPSLASMCSFSFLYELRGMVNGQLVRSREELAEYKKARKN